MRFWAIGCLAAALVASGCGDNSGDAKKGSTDTKAPLTKLKIDDHTVGKGPGAKDGYIVLLEYTATLADGTVFDSTAKRNNAPFAVTLGSGGVINGFDQGLQGIKEGGKRLISIPGSLGYRDKPPQGSPIPANADLYFDVTADKVIPPDEADKDTITFTKHGAGPKAKSGDIVDVKYKGYFVNHTVFDPGTSPLDVTLGTNQVVPGFEAALMGRQVGDKFTVTIPPVWGYGGQPKGQIPAGSWLMFDIEVVSIK